jgi:phenylalanine-4-hydroxylase
VFALDDASPNRIRFELERVMRTHYRIDDFQESYFVLGSLDELLELAHIDFLPLYQRIEGQSEFQPGQVLDSDRVLHHGSRRHASTPRK